MDKKIIVKMEILCSIEPLATCFQFDMIAVNKRRKIKYRLNVHLILLRFIFIFGLCKVILWFCGAVISAKGINLRIHKQNIFSANDTCTSSPET